MHLLDQLIVGTYLLVLVVVGIRYSRRVESLRDYCIANKSYATPVLVATTFATFAGGGDIMGLSERVFSLGIPFIILFLMSAVQIFMIGKFISPRMGRFEEALSVGDIMQVCYGRTGKIIAGMMGTFISIALIGAQITAMSFFLQYFLDVSTGWTMLLSLAIIIFYTSYGGVRSVTATDVVQFVMLVVVIPMVCNLALNYVGGWGMMIEKVPHSHWDPIPNDVSWVEYASMVVTFLIFNFQPSSTQRLLMAQNATQSRKIMYISTAIYFPFYLMVGVIGLCAVILIPQADPSMAFPSILDMFLPIGLKGFVIAGIMAVIMSTADSHLNAAGIVLAHDLITPLVKVPLKKHHKMALLRGATCFIGVLATVIAFLYQSVLEVMVAAHDLWFSSIVVPLYAGVFGFKARPVCFMVSVFSGLITLGVWKIFISGGGGFATIFPGFMASFLGFFGTHLWMTLKGLSSKRPWDQTQR